MQLRPWVLPRAVAVPVGTVPDTVVAAAAVAVVWGLKSKMMGTDVCVW